MKNNALTREEVENWFEENLPACRRDEIMVNGIYTVIKDIHESGHIGGTEEVIRKLLAEGAAIDNDVNGLTALDYICDQLPKNCIELLVDAYIKDKDENDTRYLLHSAASHDSYHYTEVLLERGFNADSVNRAKKTPLHIAAEEGYEDVVITLIQNGKCNINAQDIDGCTPLRNAVENDHFWTIKALLFYKNCNIDLQDKNGNTPLHIAISKRHDEAAYMLVEWESDIHKPNNKNITPLQMALESDNSYIKNLLNSKAESRDLPDIQLDDDLFK